MTAALFALNNTRRSVEHDFTSFDNLDGCVITHVAQYLDPVMLSRLSVTCKGAQELVSLPELWLHHCSNAWGCSPKLNQIADPKRLHTVYPYCAPVQTRVTHCTSLTTTTSPANPSVRVAFSGTVGEGNRSLVADKSFPAIPKPEMENTLLDLLIACFNGVPSKSDQVLVSRPFADLTGKLDVTPYPVAYYEVTIHPLPVTSQNRHQRMAQSEHVPECIAVGLSRRGFSLARLPGWDDLSYGYHSDDGGLFHGKGTYLCTFGPSYGVGDTVGCGVNYRTREIFYTLNGKLLGVAFSDMSGHLYPTVGIDSNVEVELNFGTKPFTFALGHYARAAMCT